MTAIGAYAGPDIVKQYRGDISVLGILAVTVNGHPLPVAHDTECFSAPSFNWGENDARTQYLAMALLQDMYGAETAHEWHGLLRHLLVHELENGQPWVLTDKDLQLFLMQVVQHDKREDFVQAARFLLTTYHHQPNNG